MPTAPWKKVVAALLQSSVMHTSIVYVTGSTGASASLSEPLLASSEPLAESSEPLAASSSLADDDAPPVRLSMLMLAMTEVGDGGHGRRDVSAEYACHIRPRPGLPCRIYTEGAISQGLKSANL